MHVYVHVPFCARRCSYCDFAIAVRSRTPDAEFLSGIAVEWGSLHPAAGGTISTLYFGGGTPSRLGGASMAELIGIISRDNPFADDAEVTIEANPDDVTPELAAAWHRAGVNRVSLGVQSHDPAVLEWMHRTHRADQVGPAIAMLRGAGIENISVDLIFALPDQLGRDWMRDLDRTLALEPQHVSLYGLTVEPHTPLARWTERGVTVPAQDSRYEQEYLAAHEALLARGFEHYEVSNAARPGFRSRHNSAYWTGADYIGLGPSAHSHASGVRSWNIRDWVAWEAAAREGRPLVAGTEQLTQAQTELESLYLGLRTTEGLPVDRVPTDQRQRWEAEGWAELAGGGIRLTALGWLRLDALVTRLATS
ncbi:MAG TPA: radical SAM family heme chaperone HemW [Gemmatimonadales bacterium]|nr:radical SAM family heme chaperone HemW [Gemmatimonadales bacterium]